MATPRPPIVTRWLIYKKAHVRVDYVLDALTTDEPPFDKWKLFGFQDDRNDKPLSASVVAERMKGRLRSAEKPSP